MKMIAGSPVSDQRLIKAPSVFSSGNSCFTKQMFGNSESKCDTASARKFGLE
jgi:hypothetical protein